MGNPQGVYADVPALSAGEVNGVVVEDYSRLTRNTAHYPILAEEVKSHNVELFFVK